MLPSALPPPAPPAGSGLKKRPASALTMVAMFVMITGILYFGRDVLIPLALSVLLTFLLAPAVRRLERAKLPRALATTVVVGVSCGVIAGLVWITANQFLSLAASLPGYKNNIQNKLAVLRSDPEGSLGRARRTITEISTEMTQDAAQKPADTVPSSRTAAARAQDASKALPAPTAVTVVESSSPIAYLREVLTPFVVPLAVTGAVIVFTFIMLLKREDLRDRLIRLVGHGHLNITTQVFEEAADRVSRYLRMQLIVNVTYGVPVGIALYWLGIPNAALWGLLAAALRFIPYLGAWIAAALPIALAFAISDGWSLVVWTLAVFLVLELVSNNIVEPWAYGASTGMSAVAIMVAAIFWTWLWGTVGLLLAVPLTVCLVVMGRYLPQFAFLSIMLGDQPVLSVPDRLYQRLLAQDQEEATELAEAYVEKHNLSALYEEVLIPVLDLAERDRHDDALSEERTRFVFDSLSALVEDLCPTESSPQTTGVVIVPARDEADQICGAMLLRSLAIRGVGAELLTTDVLKSEVVDRVAALRPQVLYISALPPGAVLHASFLCKRLRPRFPDLKVVVGLWHVDGDMEKGTARLRAAGASAIVVTLKDAIEQLPPSALVTAMQPNEPSARNQAGSAANRTSSAPSAT